MRNPVRRGNTRLALEAARILEIKAQSTAPTECGEAIVSMAPARGSIEVFREVEMFETGSGEMVPRSTGFAGFSALRRRDAFTRMIDQSKRSKSGDIFTPAQLVIARHYAGIVERHSAGGMKGSSNEARTDKSADGGGGFMDAFCAEGDEIRALRRRIGSGFAVQIQRKRNSETSRRRALPVRDLVDGVCLQEKTISEILRAYGWAKDAARLKIARKSLCEALDRMTLISEGQSGKIQSVTFEGVKNAPKRAHKS